ncbi:unnamed protein product [Amoebophrya sp. A120]|nr:unnamed protein product [Amoebophrya sp. A120]|eukprot:GSA120T00026174001.1
MVSRPSNFECNCIPATRPSLRTSFTRLWFSARVWRTAPEETSIACASTSLVTIFA